MFFETYLRDELVYVPTVARRASSPIYTIIEPVAVVPVANSEAVRRALFEAIERKNILIPDPDPKALRARPIILKYARVRSWAAFFRTSQTWSFTEKGGLYAILGYRKHPKNYWEEDPAQKIEFPPGTTIDDVVDRMIAILQEAARG